MAYERTVCFVKMGNTRVLQSYKFLKKLSTGTFCENADMWLAEITKVCWLQWHLYAKKWTNKWHLYASKDDILDKVGFKISFFFFLTWYCGHSTITFLESTSPSVCRDNSCNAPKTAVMKYLVHYRSQADSEPSILCKPVHGQVRLRNVVFQIIQLKNL